MAFDAELGVEGFCYYTRLKCFQEIFQIPLTTLRLEVFWTILKYYSLYYCQIPIQVMLLPILIKHLN